MRYIIGITGASGVIYGKRIVEWLSDEGHEIFLMVTDPAKQILKHELDIDITYFNKFDNIHYLDYHDLTAPISSGSFPIDAMIVIPCSMATLSGIACGASNNLVERAADVTLKERRRLILVPRETPLNEIHLKNMLTLRSMGADIVPAMPPFYHNPQDIIELVDAMVGKVLSLVGIKCKYKWK
jgi:4-hydroxy-3-polyprenylbenzoate decarboxylase